MNPRNRRAPLDSTIDSVSGAIAVLFDWLGREAPAPDVVPKRPRAVAAQPHGYLEPEIIDAEGEEV